MAVALHVHAPCFATRPSCRLPPNKTYFNVKQRGTNPIEPRYKLDSTHAPETTNFQATQKIVGGKLLSGDQLSATSRSIAARSSASQVRYTVRGGAEACTRGGLIENENKAQCRGSSAPSWHGG